MSWTLTGVMAAGRGYLLSTDDFETIRDVGDVTQLLAEEAQEEAI